jgi:AcrR family transcriptional regulator
MSVRERREREHARRHQLIIDAARRLAETEGWQAVTTRRLAEVIEYSQPVLYSHFAGKEAIVGAVALEGFEELSATLRRAREQADSPVTAFHATARAYLDFARQEPALYTAMFELTTDLVFATSPAPQAMTDAFGELLSVVGQAVPDDDPETCAETVWGALHGLVSLERAGRLRPGMEDARIRLLLTRFAGAA